MLQNFLGVIYATSGVCPSDIDWGYADSNIIMSETFYNIDHWGLYYKPFYGNIFAVIP